MDLTKVSHVLDGAGLTSQFRQLCKQHLEQPQKAYFIQPRAEHEGQIKKLQQTLYDTLFQHLKGPFGRRAAHDAPSSPLTELETFYAIAFDLRAHRRFDDADRLEHLVSRFQTTQHSSVSEKKSVMKLLLCLQRTGKPEPEHALGHGPLNVPVVFPDRSMARVLPTGPPHYGDSQHMRTSHMFMHYSKEVFQFSGARLDSDSAGPTLSLQIFSAKPGTGLHGRGLFNTECTDGDSYQEQNRLTLYGALVDSHTSCLDVKLDMPEITGEGYKGLWNMGAALKLSAESSTADEGFVDANSLSSIEPCSSCAESPDLWDLALAGKPSKYHTWEGRGCYEEFTERPYLAEAGPQAFDQLLDVHMYQLRLLDSEIDIPLKQTITMRHLVADAIYVLLGVPSETFLLKQASGQFQLAEGVHISGISPEATLNACKPVMDCGARYHRLRCFTDSQHANSKAGAGLIFQAFTGAVWKYLEHYVACVLGIPKDKTLLELNFLMDKVFVQMSHLASLCKCDVPECDAKVPKGVQLLSHLYEQTVHAAGSTLYPVMLSLFHATCVPYIKFVQDWVFHGVCSDVYGEFMIQVEDEYLECRDMNYWRHGYVLLASNADRSVPVFLKDMANDIFVCGKSINLLQLCAPQHFLFTVDQTVPKIAISFSEEELNSMEARGQAYLSRMMEIARQKALTRQDLLARAEKAKHDLMVQARQTAVQELDRLQEKILELKRSEDAKKRRLFSELKSQMEEDQKRRADEKQAERNEDKARMDTAVRQELLEADVEEDLENRAREELIDYYSKLTEEAAYREMKAMWLVRRRRLHGIRLDFLDAEKNALLEELEEKPMPAHGRRRQMWQLRHVTDTSHPAAESHSGPLLPMATDPEQHHLGLPSWAQGNTNSTIPDQSQMTSDLLDYVQNGLAKSPPAFIANPKFLPGWAQRALENPGQEPLHAAEGQGHEKRGQEVTGHQIQMVNLMVLPNVTDGSKIGLKQLPVVEVVGEDKKCTDTVKHPSDSTVEDLMYPNLIKDRTVQSTENPSEVLEEHVQNIIPEKQITSAILEAPKQDLRVTHSASQRRSTPKKSPKAAIKLVPGKHISTQSEAAITSRASVHMQDDFSATTESFGQPTKATIKFGTSMHATKESELTDEASTPHVKLNPDMSATKLSESHAMVKQHIRTVEGKHSSVQSTEEVSQRPHHRYNPGLHANVQSIPELPMLPSRSVHGHVSQLSERKADLAVPRLKRQKDVHASLESDWFTYQIKPHLKRVKGQSAHKQTTDEQAVIPRLKSSGRHVSQQSEVVDSSEIRLKKFREKNRYGHSSDSSVQRLLYFGKEQKNEDLEEDAELQETEFELLCDTWVEPLLDKFDFLDNAPMVDIQGGIGIDAFSGLPDYNLDLRASIDAYKFVSLPTLLKRSVTSLLKAQCSLVNQSIINYFMVDLGVQEHFKALRGFLLMEDGEFGESLSDQLFEKLATNPLPQEMLNPMYLNSVLSRALRCSLHGHKKQASNLSFTLLNQPPVLHHNAPGILDCLQLAYRVNWPLNIVIPDVTINKYGRLFSFMLELKRTVWVLKDIFYRLKRDVTMVQNISGFQFRRLQLYRHEMQLFVKVIQGYTANQIIHVTWREFQDDLNKRVHSLDELHVRHAEYLNRALCRCLLNKKATPVMKIIQDIFGLIFKFHIQLLSGRWQHSPGRGEAQHPAYEGMCRTYTSFSEYSRFLFRVVDKLAVRSYEPHLHELLLRLNFNNYYRTE